MAKEEESGGASVAEQDGRGEDREDGREQVKGEGSE